MKKGLFAIFLVFAFITLSSAKTTVSVMDLYVTSGLSKPEAEQLSKKLLNELVATNIYDVIDRNKRDELLKEQGFSQTGACDQTSCLIEAGQLLGVQKIIGGSIGLIGNLYSVELQMVDVKSGKVDMPFSHEYTGVVSSLIAAMKDAALEFSKWKPPLKTVPIKNQSVDHGNIKVFSIPPGADIYLDDKYIGVTPLLVNQIEVGNYKVDLLKDDYDKYTSFINVKPNYTLNVNATLKDVLISLKPLIYKTALEGGMDYANVDYANYGWCEKLNYNAFKWKNYTGSYFYLLNMFYFGYLKCKYDTLSLQNTQPILVNYAVEWDSPDTNYIKLRDYIYDNIDFNLVGKKIYDAKGGVYLHYDPLAIDKIFNKFYVKPKEYLYNNLKSQTVYDYLLKPYFRKITNDIEVILSKRALFDESSRVYYYKVMNEKSFVAPSYLKTINDTHYHLEGYYDCYFLGFLLRRNIDGTLPTLLKLLKIILRDYDQDTYNKIANKF